MKTYKYKGGMPVRGWVGPYGPRAKILNSQSSSQIYLNLESQIAELRRNVNNIKSLFSNIK